MVLNLGDNSFMRCVLHAIAGGASAICIVVALVLTWNSEVPKEVKQAITLFGVAGILVDALVISLGCRNQNQI